MRPRQGEQINEGESMPRRHLAHGLTVKREVLVFFFTVREIAFAGKVFKRQGRDQHESRSTAAIVGLIQSVQNECLQLGFVVVDPRRSIERFVVAEEGDNRVGFQVSEPLIRSGKKPFSVMLGVLGSEFFRARKSPLGLTRGMRPKARSIACSPEITDN